MPATPASAWTTTSVPRSSARTRASVTTGPSEVPPETMVTRPRAGGTARATQASRARASSMHPSGATRSSAARAAASARVTSTLPAPAVEQRGGDGLDLLRRLALGEDGLRRALAQLAVRVDAGEAEVAEAGLPSRHRRSSTQSMHAHRACTSAGSTAGNIPTRSWLRPSLR